MGLFVGSAPVKSVYVGSTPVTAVYVGAEKVWPTIDVVQITLGTGTQTQNQLRAALSDRGLNYQTVEEIPFAIELVGSGMTIAMFDGCSSLTSVPPMDTSQVTNMGWMFYGCSALTSVPDMDTSQVTNMESMFQECSALTSAPDMDTSLVTNMRDMFRDCSALTTAPDMDTSSVANMRSMFYGCSALTHVPDMETGQVTNMRDMFNGCAALTDGNVRLIGRHPNVNTTSMITGSGLTREPWYNADGTPDDGPTAEVYEVSLTGVTGNGTVHPLLTVTVPAGETWSVRIQGTVTESGPSAPRFRIGATDSGQYGQGAAVDFSGTVTAANRTIAMVTGGIFSGGRASFTGTVTIEK